MAKKAETTFDIQKIDINTVWSDSLQWMTEHVLNTNTVYQLVVILAAFIFSSILYKLCKKPLKEKIENSKMSARSKRIGRSLQKLLLPLIALIVIHVLSRAAASDVVGVDVWVINGMTKALTAWIFIRVMVQFIDNTAVRNTFSLIIWTLAALSIFGVLEDTMKMLDEIGFDIGDFRLSMLAVLKGIFYIFTLVTLAIFTSSLAEKMLFKTKALTKSSKVLFSKIIKFVLIAVALIMGLTSSGIDLSLFAVFGGAIGLGIGFGLQKGISNLFSGILLLLDRSVQPGDVVELDNGAFGTVNKMAARYTEIITGDSRSVLIPNEELVTQRVINWTHSDSFVQVSVPFGVHYNSDPHQVIKIAVEIAKKPTRVFTKREPTCNITGFGESAINFTLCFWIKDPENGIGNVKGEILLLLWDAFKQNAINIPYPHRDIYVHQVKEEPAKID